MKTVQRLLRVSRRNDKVANRTKLTPKKRAKFLKHLAETGFVNRSAKLVGVSRDTVYRLAKRDPEFKVAWEDAIQDHIELLEAVADRRAVQGVDRPVTYQGRITAHYKEYSDLLLIFRLKALAPEKYRDNQKVAVHVQSADDFYRVIQEAKDKG